VLQAQRHFYETLHFSVRKTRFLDNIKGLLDEKQTKVLYKMLEEETEFKGGMNAAKFMSIARVSKATATRSLADMVEKQVLISNGKGRSTNYQVNF
jgi:Fic family protein